MSSKEKHIPALRFHWLTRYYDRLVAFTMQDEKFKRSVLKYADIQSHQKVLDFGVGTATLSILAKLEFPTLDLTGLDVDEKVLKIAAENVEKAGVKLDLLRYDGVEIPFDDGSLDTIISSLVFHHLQPEQKSKALSEIFRVLKPGGTLVIADWHRPSTIFHAAGFFFVRVLDGFSNTYDHAKGNLPQIMEMAAFKEVELKAKYNSILGTVGVFSAKKN